MTNSTISGNGVRTAGRWCRKWRHPHYPQQHHFGQLRRAWRWRGQRSAPAIVLNSTTPIITRPATIYHALSRRRYIQSELSLCSTAPSRAIQSNYTQLPWREQGTFTLSRTLVSGNIAPTAPEILQLRNRHCRCRRPQPLWRQRQRRGGGLHPWHHGYRTSCRRPAQQYSQSCPGLQRRADSRPIRSFPAARPLMRAVLCVPMPTATHYSPTSAVSHVSWMATGTAQPDATSAHLSSSPWLTISSHWLPHLETSFNPTPMPGAPLGTFTIGATFTNTSNRLLRFPFFTVTELSGGNLLLNAEEGHRGVGATVTPNVGDQVLSPGETVNVDFVIGLQTSRPFTFFVDLFAEPLVSGAATARQRPNVTTKGGRR